MKIIYNDQEFRKFYFYSPKYKPKKYPKSYPCAVKIESAGGGLSGEYMAHYVKYLPKNKSDEEILKAMGNKWEYLC